MMKTVIQTTLTFTVACLALFAVTGAAPVLDGLTMSDAAAADISVPEAEAAVHPCSVESMGTCVTRPGSTCIIFNPYFPDAPPFVKEGACDAAGNDCDSDNPDNPNNPK